MTNQVEQPRREVSKASWIILAIVGALTTLSGLYVAVTPAGSQTELATRAWADFAVADPEVAGRLSMQLVLVGVSFVAFSLIGTVVALIPFRRGERWAWLTLWLFPIVYGVVTLRMLSDQYQVGYYYLGLMVVSLIGILVPVRRFL